MRAWVFVVGIAMIGCRDKDAAKPPDQGSAAVAAPFRPASGTHSTPATPVLPALATDAATLTVEDTYAAEAVDPGWKAETEQELRKRLPNLRGAQIECRTTQCRITVGGTLKELGATMDQLQAISGYAQNIMLTALEKRDNDDQHVVLHAYARFDRGN